MTLLRQFPIAHVGPYEVAAPFSTLQVLSLPSEQGIPFGRTDFNTGLWLDPHYLMLKGFTGGTSIQFLGDRQSGKTAGAQIFGYRSSPLKAVNSLDIRKRIVTDDTRVNAGVGEYKRWAKFLGGHYTDLSTAMFNALDHRMGMSVAESGYLTRSALRVSAGRDMTTTERVALLGGLSIMNGTMREASSFDALTEVMSTLTIGEHTAFIRQRTQELIKRLGENAAKAQLRERGLREINLSPSSFKQACQSVTEMLIILMEEYGHIFGPTNSLYDDLSASVVALGLTGLDEDAIPLVEMLLWTWRNSAVRRNDHNLMAHVEIHDENWKRWENLTYAENMVNHLKKIRGSGAIIIKNMHRPSDVDQVGSEGSRQRALAKTGLRETDIWFIGKTPRSEHDSIRHYVDIPQRYLDMTPTLATGEFIVKIGDILPAFRMHLDASDTELEMIQSNQAGLATV